MSDIEHSKVYEAPDHALPIPRIWIILSLALAAWGVAIATVWGFLVLHARIFGAG